ncbi:MAG: sugar O-acetyltransferase [Dysgonomonas sp.]
MDYKNSEVWQLMVAGKPYNDFADILKDVRIEAKRLTKLYNETTDDDKETRKNILTDLLNSFGENLQIEPIFRCEFGKNITIGNNVYINFECIILDCAEVTIGNDVLLGPRVGLYTANHDIDPVKRISGVSTALPITIEDRVWLGGDVTVLPGVTIGENSVIGAGSVVTKNIPENVIAAGNPCRVIKRIN